MRLERREEKKKEWENLVIKSKARVFFYFPPVCCRAFPPPHASLFPFLPSLSFFFLIWSFLILVRLIEEILIHFRVSLGVS